MHPKPKSEKLRIHIAVKKLLGVGTAADHYAAELNGIVKRLRSKHGDDQVEILEVYASGASVQYCKRHPDWFADPEYIRALVRVGGKGRRYWAYAMPAYCDGKFRQSAGSKPLEKCRRYAGRTFDGKYQRLVGVEV